MKALIFDIGGTNTKWGIVTEDFRIEEKGFFKTFEDDSDEKIINLYIKISNFINESKLEFDEVGISSAGVINFDTGMVLNDNDTFKNYAGFNIYKFLKDKTGYDVLAMNDGNSGALGEMVAGSLKGTQNSLMVVLGTGIGGGIISNSNVYSGNSYWGGEIGFSIIEGEQWEKIASAKVLIDNVSKELGKEVNGIYVYSNLDDPRVKKHYDNFVKNFSIGLLNLFMILGPEKIAIGGGISGNDSFDVEVFMNEIKKYTTENIYKRINICKAELGNDANLIGIASLLFKRGKMKFYSDVKNKLIVSVQALEDEPLHSSFIMGRMARAVAQSGACGIRANSISDIEEIKKEVNLPIIGIIKRNYEGSEVYITSTKKEIKELFEVGVDVIAIDSRKLKRLEGNSLKELVEYARTLSKEILIMADCSNLSEAIYADEIGFDIISTTFYGVNKETGIGNIFNDNMKPIRELISNVKSQIIIEGHVDTPELAEEILSEFKDDILSIVIGSAITRPQFITKRFAEKFN